MKPLRILTMAPGPELYELEPYAEVDRVLYAEVIAPRYWQPILINLPDSTNNLILLCMAQNVAVMFRPDGPNPVPLRRQAPATAEPTPPE
jgi:hypothetical protein